MLTLMTAKDLSSLLTKSSHWEYEKEWRMMVDLNEATEVKVIGDSQYHLFDFPRASIKSVILGCRITEATKLEIRQTLSRFDGGQLGLFQCEVDKRLFKLNLNQIQIG